MPILEAAADERHGLNEDYVRYKRDTSVFVCVCARARVRVCV